MNDNTELKRLADAAKNWGGEVGEDRWYTAECFKQPYFSVPDAEFIAACDPGSIRALIAENERLQGCEEVLRQLASYCGCGGYNAPEVDPEVFAKKIMDGINILNDPLVALADKRAAERDELKLEVAGLKTGYEAYERVKAEVGALRREREGKVLCDLELFETLRDSANTEADEHRQCMATYRPLRQESLDSVVKKCDDLLAALGQGEQS